MRFFIIGPTGSIGQELVPELVTRGHEVVGLTRRQATADRLIALGGRPVMGDIAHGDVWQAEAAQADALVNLCSLPTTRGGAQWVTQFGELNSAACQGLFEAAQHGGKCRALIVASGVYVVGDHGDEWIDEDTPPNPHPMMDVYGPSERWVEAAHRSGIPGVALRFGSIYSPNPTGTFGRAFLAAIAKGQFRYPGDGKSYFPLVSMPDAVAAIIQAAETSACIPYLYIVDDEPIRMKDAFTLLSDAFGRQAKSMPRWLLSLLAGNALGAAIADSFRVRNQQAKTALNWRPRHPIFRDQVNSLVSEYIRLRERKS